MKCIPRTLLLLLCSASLTACGDPDLDSIGPNSGEGRSTLRAAISRDEATELPVEVSEVQRGNINLSLDLLREAGEPGQNQMISAYSIRSAFAQVYGGAAGRTALQMEEVLRFGIVGEAFHSSMNAVDQALNRRTLPATSKQTAVEFHTANSVWGRPDLPWMPSYLELLGRYYGSAVETIDFRADPEKARQVINAWVEAQTAGRIKELLPLKSINISTQSVLTNAVYFKAPWAKEFSTELTRPLPFTTLAGDIAQVPTMIQEMTGGFARGDGWFAFEKNFRGHALSMVFIVPDAGTFTDFESALNGAKVQEIIDALETTELSVRLPKFSFETSTELKTPLVNMGLTELFSNEADLSGMTRGGGLKVNEAYHKTFVAIDEGGGEAAASTAIVTGFTTSIPDPVTIAAVDRPFVFAIRDIETGVFLFYGRVVDPS